jgi:hypothetical protein
MIMMLVPLIGAIAKKDVNILTYHVMTTMNVLMMVVTQILDVTIHLSNMTITTLVPKMDVIVLLDHTILK